MVGHFIPTCAEDGSYAPMQCHASTGYCWCASKDGKKIPKTEIRGRPNCKCDLHMFYFQSETQAYLVKEKFEFSQRPNINMHVLAAVVSIHF